MPPLRGREREVAALAAAIDELATGAGVVTLLLGEPGMGKSRLLDHAFELARSRGITCLRVNADEHDSSAPLSTLLSGLAVPEHPPALASGAHELARDVSASAWVLREL